VKNWVCVDIYTDIFANIHVFISILIFLPYVRERVHTCFEALTPWLLCGKHVLLLDRGRMTFLWAVKHMLHDGKQRDKLSPGWSFPFPFSKSLQVLLCTWFKPWNKESDGVLLYIF
jgi:hypothetical protein